MNREFKAKKEEDMKIVFFDMEFANGKIPGSVYSLGYVQTNGRGIVKFKFGKRAAAGSAR